MTDNHLHVPSSSPSSPASPPSAAAGRRRSGSGSHRSQRSGRSAERPQQQQQQQQPDYARQPSIRIRRFSQAPPVVAHAARNNVQDDAAISGRRFNRGANEGDGGRRRSFSDPQRPAVNFAGAGAWPGTGTGNGNGNGNGDRIAPTRLTTRHSYMPGVAEETFSPTSGAVREGEQEQRQEEGLPVETPQGDAIAVPARPAPPGRLRRARTNIASKFSTTNTENQNEDDEYAAGLVDLLDAVDPEVGTLTTLTNLQNSLFVPDIPYLGNLYSRRPTYALTRRPTDVEEAESSSSGDAASRNDEAGSEMRIQPQRTPTSATLNTISSRVNDKYYAVLPHGVSLPGWSEEEKLELNDHVRHMLHSKRSKFKRGMKGFGQYVRKPLGFFVTLYAVLITLFGLAWVLFLIGWIKVGGRRDYIINVIDNVLVALFAIMGDGLAPFRAVDTYHMCFIAHYHHLTWRLRRERALPSLQNHNDLPSAQPDEVDNEKEEFSVLNPEQVEKLAHHQKKFAKSHSFYKPHATTTHHAFPLRLLVAIVVLLDCHSLLQISLGACTWGISYHVRPFALTTVILCCSITVNITAGVLISIGDHRTRKKDVVEKMFRQDLTAEAMKRVEKKREKEIKRTTTPSGLLEPIDSDINTDTEVQNPSPHPEMARS